MCAIIGANFDFDYDNSLSHRGPDNLGEYKDNYLSLFHNRLSIIDLKTHSNQPFFYKDYILVFNGEIYNYIELKKELKEYNFKTTSDTEVLLYAYDKWGKECLNRFNGDFAFCIYNKKTKKLFCARDRVGNKPFYYYFNSKKFIFASEIKALKNYITQFNIQKLGDAILFSINDNDEHTIYKNIYNLKPSHYLEFDLKSNKLKTKQWYFLPKRKIKTPYEEFEYLIKDAIKIRLRSDVKIANMLSGGIDSSIIAYYMQNYPQYSVIYNEVSEKKYIKLMQKRYNLDINYLYPPLNIDIKKLMYIQEDIFRSLSIYAEYYLFSKANTKVMLSGQGADEIFGGYYHHIARFILDKKMFKQRLKLYKNQALEELKIGIKFVLSNKYKKTLLKEDNLQNLKQLKNILNEYKPNWDLLLEKFDKNINKTLKKEVFSLNLSKELRQQDKNSMYFSIENRTPFTDYRIIEFGLNLDKKYKFKGYSKFFLRQFAKKFLPKEIVFRLDKQGFEVPELKLMKQFNLKSLFEFRVYQYFILKDLFVNN